MRYRPRFMRPLFPLWAIDSFQNLMKLWVANRDARDGRARTPAVACQHIRGKDVRYDREADTLARLDSGDGCVDGDEHTNFSAKPPRHRHWSDNCQRL